MADHPIVHIGENSPEHVAFKLLHEIAGVERKTFMPHVAKSGESTLADRDWILSTYVQCLHATKHAVHKKT